MTNLFPHDRVHYLDRFGDVGYWYLKNYHSGSVLNCYIIGISFSFLIQVLVLATVYFLSCSLFGIMTLRELLSNHLVPPCYRKEKQFLYY